MEFKYCYKCNKTLSVELFYNNKTKKDRLSDECKECVKAICTEIYYRNHEATKQKRREYVKTHKDLIKNIEDKSRKEHLDRHNARGRRWKQNNRQYARDYQRKIRENPIHRILMNSRRILNNVISKQGINKKDRFCKLLGCTTDEFYSYIENLFYLEMSWKNYGTIWEMDHKIPLASFDLSKEDQQQLAFHYTNTQPLLCLENRSKGSLYNGIRYLHNK